jgi:hypothetical protein
MMVVMMMAVVVMMFLRLRGNSDCRHDGEGYER